VTGSYLDQAASDAVYSVRGISGREVDHEASASVAGDVDVFLAYAAAIQVDQSPILIHMTTAHGMGAVSGCSTDSILPIGEPGQGDYAIRGHVGTIGGGGRGGRRRRRGGGGGGGGKGHNVR
jgi:hypothetical protein